jgi:hypothetical protein
MNYNRDDPSTWPGYRLPTIIAHDVGGNRDRSTAVVGGFCPWGSPILGIGEIVEFPQGLFGNARANALAAVDRHYEHNSIIVADLTYDPSYAEVLLQIFGPRVIGAEIRRYGDGMKSVPRQTAFGTIPIYPIGRTFLLDNLHSKFQSGQIRMVDGPMSQRAYEQLAKLETEMNASGIVYKCPAGEHDDLGISVAMLVWAAHHPHFQSWFGYLRQLRTPRRPRPAMSASGWT